MNHNNYYLVALLVKLIAIFLIGNGAWTCYTQRCHIWIHYRPIPVEGLAAVLLGIFEIVLGVWFFYLAVTKIVG